MARLLAPLAVLVLAGSACDDPSYQGRLLSSWMHDLDSDIEYKRRQACEAIGEIGPPAKRAIPALIERLEDPNAGVREFAEVALGQIGPDSVALLEEALGAEEPMTRLHAAAALVHIDHRHPRAAAELVNAATGIGHAELSTKARDVLVRLGEPAVALLLPTLEEPYEPVRLVMVKTVAKLGARAAAAVPTLETLAKADKSSDVRRAAIQAMAAIGPAEAVAPTFRELTQDPDEDVAGTAGSMLQYIGARASATGTEGHVESAGPGPGHESNKRRRSVTNTEHLNIINQPADAE